MDGLLKQMGWSARQFADQIGVDEQTVYEWTAGRNQDSGYRIAMLYLELVTMRHGDSMSKAG